ncbi:MAG: tetratricopeptide repeat protein [Nitrospina sp.]|jgi:protein O-mannosyl-transferase|nr:tetratricopeptide repeat protein [Nitrospina sp.]
MKTGSISRQTPRVTFSAGALVLIALLSCVVYSNTLDNDYFIDDDNIVLGNPAIKKVWPLSRHFSDFSTYSTRPEFEIFRPLVPLTLSINYAISGGHSRSGYHIFNIGVHTLSAMIAYLLCLELLCQTSLWGDRPTRHRWLALFVATVFAVHPVSGIPVNYISGRDLLMMEFFSMSSFLLYIRMRRIGDSWWQWFFVLLLSLLSLCSKQNAVVMPGLIFAYECTVRQRSFSTLFPWLRAAPFGALVAGVLIYSHLASSFSIFNQAVSGWNPVIAPRIEAPWMYPLMQLRAHLSHYAINFIWPLSIHLGPVEDGTIQWTESLLWLGLIFVLGTIYLAWRIRRDQPIISFCIFAYWIAFIPTSSIVPLHVIIAHYRAYPSSFYIYLALGLTVFQMFNRKVLVGICLTTLVYFSAIAVYLNTTWKNGETLWKHSIAQNWPRKNPVNYLNVAMNLGDVNQREIYLRKSLEIAPYYTLAKINLGLLLIHKGQKEEGLDLVKEGAAHNFDQGQGYHWLAIAYNRTGKVAEAAEAAAKAAHLHPWSKYQYKAGLLLQNAGRYEDSITYLKAVQEPYPGYERTGFLLGFAHQQAGRNLEAIESYQDYLGRKPRDSQAQFNLAYAYLGQGEFAKAVEGFRNVLDLKPAYYEAHLHLSTCYKKLGDDKKSQEHSKIWERRRGE